MRKNINKSYDASWKKGFKLLLKYVKHKGHSLIPLKYVTKDGYKLGHWISTQRVLYKQGKLLQKRKIMLEQIPTWVWDIHEVRWHEGFINLLKYIGIHQNALVPKQYITKNGYKLGIWVMYQRERYKQKSLPLRYKKALERLPGWMWEPRKDLKKILLTRGWLKGLDRLNDYVKREGDSCVPQFYVTSDGYKLGKWVRDQRLKRKKGELSQEQQKILRKLPRWTWDVSSNLIRISEKWKLGFRNLEVFVTIKGHAKVPAFYMTDDGYKLGTWVRDQRYKKKKGKLSEEQSEMLENLPDWIWDARCARNKGNSVWSDLKWEQGFKHLQAFVASEGHAKVPFKYITKDGYKLGVWVSCQRQNYRKEKLASDRIQSLEKLFGWAWNTNSYWDRSKSIPIIRKWEQGFKYLQAFISSEGHSKVPALYVNDDGYKLGLWVTIQRQNYRKQKLTDDRIQSLGKLPGWSWRIRASGKWEHGFKYLKSFVKNEGHARVPFKYVTKDGYKLGAWVSRKRQSYLKGNLSEERIQSLEKLPGWTWFARK